MKKLNVTKMSTEEVLRVFSDESGYALYYLRTVLVENFCTSNLFIKICEHLEEMTGVDLLSDDSMYIGHLKPSVSVLQVAMVFSGEIALDDILVS